MVEENKREFLVVFDPDLDMTSIVVSVKDDERRTINPNAELYLQQWINESYGIAIPFSYFEISSSERYDI